MTSKSKLVYDPVTLIELVEERKCIWDKFNDDYKDKTQKARAWTEVYNFLVPNFENLNSVKQIAAGKSIQDKWKHLRDAFSLSLKKKSGDNQTKKYLYADNLQFLLKIFQKAVTESSISDYAEKSESEEETSSTTSSAPVLPEAMAGSSRTRNRKRSKFVLINETDKAIIAAVEASSKPPAEIDADTAFFTSVTPSVKNFSEDEKLEFRMGILNLIKTIKAKRNRLPIAQNAPYQMEWSVPPNTSYQYEQLQ